MDQEDCTVSLSEGEADPTAAGRPTLAERPLASAAAHAPRWRGDPLRWRGDPQLRSETGARPATAFWILNYYYLH